MDPTNPINITPEGVVIAFLFVSAIAGTLLWMIRLPQVSPATVRVARAVRSVTGLSRILAPTHGGELSDRIIGLAAQVARRQGATLEILYVHEVPRYFPMDAIIPEEEANAREALVRATRIAQSFGIKPVVRIVRARDAGPAIVREAEDSDVDLIMMGAGPPPRPRLAGLGPAADHVFRYASCEVILDRSAIPEEESPWAGSEFGPPERELE